MNKNIKKNKNRTKETRIKENMKKNKKKKNMNNSKKMKKSTKNKENTKKNKRNMKERGIMRTRIRTDSAEILIIFEGWIDTYRDR